MLDEETKEGGVHRRPSRCGAGGRRGWGRSKGSLGVDGLDVFDRVLETETKGALVGVRHACRLPPRLPRGVVGM